MTSPAIKLESAVFPVLTLSVDDRTYTLCFPVSAVVKAESAVGHSLKTLSDWIKLETKHMPSVIEAGLLKYHADISADAFQNLCDNLTPESLDELHYALCRLAFPRAMASIEENLKQRSENTSPNSQSPKAAA